VKAPLHYAAASAMFHVIQPRTGCAGQLSQLVMGALRKSAHRRAAKQDGLTWQELQNMLDAVWNFGPGNAQFVGRTIRKTSASTDFYRSLWATEGLGFFEAERSYRSNGPPPRLTVDGLPPVSASVFLLGVHLAVAIRRLRGVGSGNSVSWDSALHEMLDFNAREGDVGLAIEALGFVTRTLFPGALLHLDRELQRYSCDAAGYFWHGVGRGLYFLFPRALFSNNSRYGALKRAAQEPPHETARLNVLAGLGFAVTLVNILHPEVLQDWLTQHPELRQSDAFSSGIASATALWHAWVESIPMKQTADLFCYHPSPVTIELEHQ
jgi:hypothetical protein